MNRMHPLLLAAVLGLSGCASALRPAPEANLVAEGAAFAAAGNMQMVVRAEAWQGTPPSLDDAVTPMLITIENHGNRPVRIAYDRLRLLAANGRAYYALAPQSIEGSVTVMLEDLDYAPLAFEYVPEAHVSPYILGARSGTGWIHPANWHTLDPGWREVRLPTLDMLRKALAEGVLEPGGVASGFVYFERLPAHAGRFEVQAGFPAADGERVIRLEIPFVVG